MNILQGLDADTTFCVTLNASESIRPEKVIDSFEYSHPVFSLDGIAAAKKIEEFNGLNRSWFVGAYLGNGFHEDGVVSGRKVADAINRIAASAADRQEFDTDPVHA
jgi:predicted NAD/FAD-binding protein